MTTEQVEAFYDGATGSISYVVYDPESQIGAIIDPVMGFIQNRGKLDPQGADALIEWIVSRDLQIEWILETHVHADHVTAASYLKDQLGGQLGIGSEVTKVQQTFAKIFGLEGEIACDGSQFDRLFKHLDTFSIGTLKAQVLHTPGHTPACISYLIGNSAFVGDTLFMPDVGTARCDFPGGSAAQLFHSVQALYQLSLGTQLYTCHDYPPENQRSWQSRSSVAEQQQINIHLKAGTTEADFLALRQKRDETLDLPDLMLPSVQLNINAGKPSEVTEGETAFLKIPLNYF